MESSILAHKRNGILALQAALDLQERTQHLRQRNAAISQENHMSVLVPQRQLTHTTLPNFMPLGLALHTCYQMQSNCISKSAAAIKILIFKHTWSIGRS